MGEQLEISAKLQKKRGPEPDPRRVYLRQMFSEWSERTFATYYEAWCIFAAIGDEQAHESAIKLATRPNGSMNITRYRRLADMALMRSVMAGDFRG